jgi:hypothetical protein
MFPLRGLWHNAPEEGDYLITCEVDWLVSPPGNAVQFSVAGNSPVALSQIVALAVDNSKSGADVQFIFTDSGFKLTVPSHNQVVAPVFTNALSFIASAPAAVIGDQTVFQILNSAAMPVSIAPSSIQNHVSLTENNLNNASTPLIPAPASGSLNTISIVVYVETVTAGDLAQIQLVDGTGALMWTQVVIATAAPQNLPFDLSGLNLRFSGGVSVVISESTLAGGFTVNAYYSTP